MSRRSQSPTRRLRRAAGNALRAVGLEVRTVPPTLLAGRVGGELYQAVRPMATYSPWNKDKHFLRTHSLVRDHTLVDVYRCYELWTLVEQTSNLRGSLLEVGVWRGGTGALIAARAAACGMSDPIYLCDTFSGVVKASSRDSVYHGGEHRDTSRATVEQLLERLALNNAKILAGVFPEETGHMIASDTFRFCHIDVDVYDSANDILNWLWDRLVPGGIVVYDDYGFRTCDGITKHVEEQRPKPDRLIIHNLNGHAILVKMA